MVLDTAAFAGYSYLFGSAFERRIGLLIFLLDPFRTDWSSRPGYYWNSA